MSLSIGLRPTGGIMTITLGSPSHRPGRFVALACRLWRHVFEHQRLIWLQRELRDAPGQAQAPDPSVHVEAIAAHNLGPLQRHFPQRMTQIRHLAAEGYTGVMCVDASGDAVAMSWGSTRHYHDRHGSGCWFAADPGAYFEFASEVIAPYRDTRLAMTLHLALAKAMAAQGCHSATTVCQPRDTLAQQACLRMGYKEQGRIMNVYRLFGRWTVSLETRYQGTRLRLSQSAAVRADAPGEV